jgi:hypothetical protein
MGLLVRVVVLDLFRFDLRSLRGHRRGIEWRMI